MALMQLLSICYQKAFESAANPHKHWVFMTLQLIQTRFFSPKLKQICLSFMSFPISFISFSYRVLTYLSSVAVALPCMYYIREEVKSEDFI